MDRRRRRVLVTLAVVCIGAVAASTAESAPGARTGTHLVKEYPFAVSVAWNIDDTFTTTCGDQRSQTVTGELHVVAQATKPALAIWVPGKTFEAQGLDPFGRSHGREAWSIQTSTSVDPACAPLQTDATACSGTWNTRKWWAVGSFTSGLDTIQQPVLTVRHTAGKPPIAWRFFCLAPTQSAAHYAPNWWGDGASPIFNPQYDNTGGPAVAASPGITDCRQRTLTLRFSDTYTQDNSDQWSVMVQTENATATVTLKRLNSGVRLVPIYASIPGWQNMKPTYGC